MRLNWLRLELLDLFLSWQTQQEQRKLACAMPNAARYCLSKKDDSYCCFLFIHHIIFYMCKRHVLPQISQIYADKRQAGKWNYNYNNGRSRVSRGNKMQKLRKFYHMFYLKKSQKTHLKVYGKKLQESCLLCSWFIGNFHAGFSWHL